eukprot:TRINITY_DN1070_c0_g1_i1.p1 TRINITY_DN1070_c0_g1~~TRINITY_DN1070_c0_g1_i1.p1  ORF type:complete len:105 (+),score=33.23 TRINITY_DN1070_c0_g1_i1:72-386(+)
MCIRDRVSTQSTWGIDFEKEMKASALFILIISALLVSLGFAANCFQVAQDFKCPYMELKCNGEEGSCLCNDGTYCKWQGTTPTTDNCPCDDDGPRRKARKISDL